jgi:hypothetical protein
MLLKFDWDQWNVQKNETKHGVSKLEAESLFFDEYLVIFEDIIHSNKNEVRWIGYGLCINNRILMCAFTIRNKKVRIISCRAASRKERLIYEKAKIN